MHSNYVTNQNIFEILLNQTEIVRKQTDVRLVPNQSENDKYNLIWVWFDKISKIFLCV